MIQQFSSEASARTAADPFGRRLTITHIATVAVVAIMAVAALLMSGRALHDARAMMTANLRTEHERMLSQRIASLSAQYALGDRTAGDDLRTATDEFETLHWSLVGGDRSAGIASAISDPGLKSLYFGGQAPLDALATEFIGRARHLRTLPAGDPALRAQLAPMLLAARGPLTDALGRAQTIRTASDAAEQKLWRSAAAIACALLMSALMVANIGVFRPMARRIVKLMDDVDRLTRYVAVDPLTGTLNKRSFQARGAIEIQKARRYGRPLSLLMIDADHLTSIEAAHGSSGGDTLLKALTSSFSAGTRISDLIARVDTEQFAILLPETDRAGAELLAERIRQRVGALTIAIDDTVVSSTVSIGVASAEKDASFLWPTCKRADEALYEAKMRGRNQVVVAA